VQRVQRILRLHDFERMTRLFSQRGHTFTTV
jgi:hypothetical protein